MAYIHELPKWPALTGTARRSRVRWPRCVTAKQAPRQDAGARIRPPSGSQPLGTHRGGRQIVSHRGRAPRREGGSIVDRAQARTQRRWSSGTRAGSRRRRRHDARRDSQLRPAAHRGADLRVARGALPHRTKRDATHHRGGPANGRRRADAVVSGPIGRERVHFQAPDAARLGDEMERFLEWFGALNHPWIPCSRQESPTSGS